MTTDQLLNLLDRLNVCDVEGEAHPCSDPIPYETDGNEYIEFERIPPMRQLFSRPDLCAFLLLAAEHDEFGVSISLEELAAATDDPEDIATLVRCGMRCSDESLCWFT